MTPEERVANMARTASGLLVYLGEDPDREGLKKTPERMSKMLLEMTRGLRTDPPRIALFDKGDNDQMVTMLDIDYYSLCIPSKQYVNGVKGSMKASSVKVGDKLWTLKEGQVVETEVIEITSHKVPSTSIVEVETEEGIVKVTEDHPFATYGGWMEAKDLEGQFVEWTNPKSLHRNRYRPVLGHSLGYVIGAVTSDGSVSKRHVTFQVTDKEFAYKYCEHLNKAFSGMDAKVEEDLPWPSGYRGETISGHRVRVTSSYLADLFRMWLGGDAHHMKQKFPHVVKSSEEMARGFVEGYIDGDGSRSKTQEGSTVVCGNVDFLREFATMTQSRSEHGHKATNAWALYVSDRWYTKGGGRQGWNLKHGFEREDHRTDLVESKFVKVLSVRHMPKAIKPYTVYSFKCSKEPTLLIEGHLAHNCEHHMAPFNGKVHIGYLPSEYIVGLSKFARIVDWVAARPQTQEYMTAHIANHFMKVVEPQGVIVMVEGTHLCMAMRGAKKPNHLTVTTAIRGDVDKNEFLKYVNMRR